MMISLFKEFFCTEKASGLVLITCTPTQGGIGFRMSIFISILAFQDVAYVQESKIAILVSSAIAGVTGYCVVRGVLSRSTASSE